MFINERGDPLAVPSATVSSSSVPVPVDNTPLPPLSMVALKIYGFGGLAFMIGIIASAIMYWIWTVIIKREYADSPPELDLHPELMREKEKARIARLKILKHEKELKRRLREEEKFTPPPLYVDPKTKPGRSRPHSISIPQKERIYPTNRAPTMANSGRNRSNSMPIKPAMRKSSLTVASPPRKSSISFSPSKGKRVSWASSISTLDVNGNGSRKPLDVESNNVPIHCEPETSSSHRSPTFSTLPSNENLMSPIPKARTSVPRLSLSVAPRARRGQEMISATTPEVAVKWARPDDPLGAGWPCYCVQSVDPFDNRGAEVCDMHRYRD